MADKTWTAVDVVLGKLTIHRLGDALQIERRYKFLDINGEALEQIAGGRILETVLIVEIPANILSALQEIDNWTKTKALQKEGMA